MIEAQGLTKRFGNHLALDDLSFCVRPGRVTGFLGPNGAGKSTTMRCLLGLDLPSAGSATVNGRRYGELKRPLFEVGVLLDASWLQPGRTAFSHLVCIASSNGIGRRRVEEVLGLVGLDGVAGRRGRALSLGMRQRLGIAVALLGDPGVLVFDEPANGLDPEGVHWVRLLLRSLAAEGRTVFVSSHLMSEMAITANHLLVIGRGRLLADASLDELAARSSRERVEVRSAQADRLAAVLEAAGAVIEERAAPALRLRGLDAVQVGEAALAAGIAVHELVTVRPSLEEAYLELTGSTVELRSGGRGEQPAGA